MKIIEKVRGEDGFTTDGQLCGYGRDMKLRDGETTYHFSLRTADGREVRVEMDADTYKELKEGW